MAKIKNFPASVAKYNAYNSGDRLVGVTGTVTLPTLEFIKATLQGAGMGGSMDVSVPGQTNNLQVTIPFATVSREYIDLIRPGQQTMLTLRASLQELDHSGALHHVPLRVVLRGSVGSITLGELAQAQMMNASIVLDLSYIKVEYDGETLLEHDKLNGSFVVNGEDIMADIDAMC